MDPVRNPYSPGAGRRPIALVGRDAELGSWDTAIARLALDRSTQPLALYGLRGVGKTVLLSEFRRRAESRGWIVAQVEAGAGKSLRTSLADGFHAPLTDIARPAAGRRLLRALKTALSFRASLDPTGSWSFGLDLTETQGGGADTGIFETDLSKLVRDLSAAASEEDIGLAILIDEAQDLTSEELAAVCAIAHQAGQEGWRCLIGLAGLPSLPRELAEAKSYAERLFAFTQIGPLVAAAAREALVEPARIEDVSWEAAALDHVVRDAAGYPYFLQQFGQESWNEALGSSISEADARAGTTAGWTALDTGFFRARWDRATPVEQQYLRAIAIDGDAGGGTSNVANRLGRTPASLGPTRAKLIAKGLIYAPEHGMVAFTVPGMAHYIQRQPGFDGPGR